MALTVLPLHTETGLLRGIPSLEAKAIFAAAAPRQYLAHSVICNQSSPAEHLFLLRSGRARHFFVTPDGKKISLMWLRPGELFGGAAFLSDPADYLVSTEAITDIRAMVWDRATLRQLGSRCPRLLENALEIATRYLAWYVATHAALVSDTADQRLGRILICLAETIGHKVEGGIELDVTNEELGSAANITPYTASRLLSAWQRNRALTRKRGKILLKSPERIPLQKS